VSSAHPFLRPDWTRPAPPEGFDALVCCDYGELQDLDFVNNTRRDFASETLSTAPHWPWLPAFDPQPADWRAIGIEVFDFR
jgi:hypothetical protein